MHTTSTKRAILSSFLLLPTIAFAASSIDCEHIRVNEVSYRGFKDLGGPKTVYDIEQGDPGYSNFTYTIDLCYPLSRASGNADLRGCSQGANICAIKYDYDDPASDDHIIHDIRPIAGNFHSSTGKTQDAVWTPLKNSPSNADADRDGLRLEIGGGKFPPDKKNGQDPKPQKAIIEFICDPEWSGVEGLETWDDNFAGKGATKRSRRTPEDEDEGGEDGGKEGEDNDDDTSEDKKALHFKGKSKIEVDKTETEVFRFEWRTKAACADSESEKPKSSGSWGFFTWFIIILFLAVAAYLIFGSWLNYNRYGARGWDLLPHGDTIRDLPYLLKDWARRVTGSFQSGGSRGGYAAV